MNSVSRTENSVKNISVGVIGQILSLLLSFINRTVFINTLGGTYLGVNGLFTSVLSFLSVAELGVGNAIIYNMYKPLAENNRERLQGLMKLYAEIYHVIGYIVAILGLLLIPFLKYMIDENTRIPNVIIIYLLFLFNSVMSYFFSYKRSIINADQKSYIINTYQYAFNVIQIIVQVIILKTTQNFIVYLVVQIIFSLTLNIVLSNKANKLYPFIKEKNNNKLNKEEKKDIFKNIYAIFMYKVNAIIINSTDNIIISMFIGVTYVGLYSNYLLIVNAITMILSIVFNSLTSSIGNLNASETAERKYDVYKVINFVSFWLYGFASICLWNLMNPFIELWIGKMYLLDNFTLLIIIINFYTTGIQFGTTSYRDSTGLFWNGRYIPVFASLINIGISVMLVNRLGIAGVLLGTIISRIATYFWFDPKMLFENVFKENVSTYFKQYISYALMTLTTAIIIQQILIYTSQNFIVKLLVSIIIPNSIFLIIYYKSFEFNFILKKIKFVVRTIKQ